jgi:hypothetical protein
VCQDFPLIAGKIRARRTSLVEDDRMTARVVHVVFGSAAADTLRQALAEDGCPEEVVSSDDDFRLGPIASADAAGRVRGINDILGSDDWLDSDDGPGSDDELESDDGLGSNRWDLVVAGNAPLLAASIAQDIRPVVWFSRRDAYSYAGFLWWLSHLGEAPCEIVDVTEMMIVGDPAGDRLLPPHLAVSPGLVPPHEMVRLREMARPLLPEERRRYQSRWQSLVRENAPLRVLDNGELVSAPITFFDPLLLSCVISSWRKMLRIVGEAMGRLYEDELSQTGDWLLFVRLRHLAETGVVEWEGDITRVHYCEMRLWEKADS